MHKTQSGSELPSINVHLLIQEDEVHLEEDEHQLETGAQEPKDKETYLVHLVALRVAAPGHRHCMSVIFKYFSKLHTSVDETANAKDCKG